MTDAGRGDSRSLDTPAPMTAERWRKVDAILRRALEYATGEREAFVRDASGEDEALRQELLSLLAAHDGMAKDFLERPAAGFGDHRESSAPNDQATLLAKALDGRYTIEREIARGGMATVFLARDLKHDRLVAMKVLRDEVAAVVGAERFLEEIRVTALLQHPHILPLFDSGSVGGLLWYVMPFAEGETLRSRLEREGPLPIDEAVRLAREIADALKHAHAHGIVHRDVKPENVLLQGGHALVADFGIALALERAGGERLTRTGLTLGTPQYMAPEQAAGERALDARVDVYALGAVVHEMLTGAPPFAAGSRQAMLHSILHDPPAPLARRRADVPVALDGAVRRSLSKRPAERFASAAAFAAALTAAPDETPVHTPAPTRVPEDASRQLPNAVTATSRTAARIAPYVAIAAIAGIGVGLVGGWSLAHSPIAQRWTGDSVAPSSPARTPGKINFADGAIISGVRPRDGISLVVVDRAGVAQRRIAANRPWTPRFSPDGRRIAYGAFGPGRSSSDIWVVNLDDGKTQRLTDDDGDSNDPQWSPDGSVIAYSVNRPGGKDVATRRLSDGTTRLFPRAGAQFPTDWPRDGSAVVAMEDAGSGGRDIIVQPANGSRVWAYAATPADETTARVSPDGRWIAYTSDASGRAEVYLDSYPRPGNRVLLSRAGGIHPVWRGDGRELYYWRDDTLVAVKLGTTPKDIGAESVLFRAPYLPGINTMYDASPDGDRFVIVEEVK